MANFNAYTECLIERIGYLDAVIDISKIVRDMRHSAPNDEIREVLADIEYQIEAKNVEKRTAHELDKKRKYDARE